MKKSSGALAAALATVPGACTRGEPPATSAATSPPAPELVDRLVTDRAVLGDDVVEVWICDVPGDTVVALYGDLALRVGLTPADVVDRIGDGVGDYFDGVSQGAYSPHLVAGGTVAMGATDTDADCVDAALDRSSSSADAVLAVATAEHTASSPGGWGRPGTWLTCSTDCSAAQTRRAAYVGASDFSPEREGRWPRDLVEHELGHTLGLPHSNLPGVDGATPDTGYTSPFDVMSNSAAPHERDPARLDAPGPIGIDRLDLGWLPLDAVTVVEHGASTLVELAPVDADEGPRLAVLRVDDHTVVTVEHRTATGFDDHLRWAGAVVHVVDDAGGRGMLRSQIVAPGREPAAPTAPLQAGERVDVAGHTIEVVSVGATIRVAVAPSTG